MAANRIPILIFMLIMTIQAWPQQTFWKVANEYGDEILLTIDINKEKNTFEAFTRKDALKDIAGTFTYTLAKTAGKLKYPEIVFIEGRIQNIKDSIKLTGTFTYFDKQFPFTATISGTQFRGVYTDKNRQRKLNGVKLPNNKPIKDYRYIINTCFALAEKTLVNPGWAKSGGWVDFKSKIDELKPKIADDYELAAAIEWLGKKLPFSPFEISKINPKIKSGSKKTVPSFRELNAKTVLFEVNSMPTTKTEMDSIAGIIGKKGYENLILDVRGRNSINPAAANLFANFVSQKTCIAGVYLTRKWFESNANIPVAGNFDKLFQSFAEPGFQVNSLHKETGRMMKIVPMQKTFKGKVYVLTDSGTSKAAEVLVQILKTEKLATIVGQKTNGSASLTERLPINNEFELILPVADFYNSEGKALKKEGIEPDVNVSGEDILKYVLKTI